jgi:quinoprotein glucose dehydrogenase
VVSQINGPLATLMGAFATNWPGGSYDPETHVLYVYSQSGIIPLGLVKPSDPKIDLNYVQGSATAGMRMNPGSGGAAGADATPAARAEAAVPPPAAEGGGGGMNVRGLPLIKPPYGRITAIDLDKGDFVWQVPHGETPDNVKNNPALKGLTIPRTGQAGNIGTLVTKTLVIAGEPRVTMTSTGARGAMLRAYDKASGKEVGAVYMPAPQSGSPMTYMLNGKQYIVIAISGGNYSGELLAFRLPG